MRLQTERALITSKRPQLSNHHANTGQQFFVRTERNRKSIIQVHHHIVIPLQQILSRIKPTWSSSYDCYTPGRAVCSCTKGPGRLGDSVALQRVHCSHHRTTYGVPPEYMPAAMTRKRTVTKRPQHQRRGFLRLPFREVSTLSGRRAPKLALLYTILHYFTLF